MVKYYNEAGLLNHEVKVFSAPAIVESDGKWRIDYSHVGFKYVYSIQATPVYNQDSIAENPVGASVVSFTTEFAQGYSARGASMGLLVGVANLPSHRNTKIMVTIVGE